MCKNTLWCHKRPLPHPQESFGPAPLSPNCFFPSLQKHEGGPARPQFEQRAVSTGLNNVLLPRRCEVFFVFFSVQAPLRLSVVWRVGGEEEEGAARFCVCVCGSIGWFPPSRRLAVILLLPSSPPSPFPPETFIKMHETSWRKALFDNIKHCPAGNGWCKKHWESWKKTKQNCWNRTSVQRKVFHSNMTEHFPQNLTLWNRSDQRPSVERACRKHFRKKGGSDGDWCKASVRAEPSDVSLPVLQSWYSWRDVAKISFFFFF